jgi:mannitol/fructose-specific phosphotransferase system IIA component (Ntr-type)
VKLLGFLERDAIKIELESSTKEDAIRELAKVVVARGLCDPKHQEELVRSILEREKKGTTGLGDGFAVPHVKESPHVKQLCGAFGRSRQGIPFDAIDGKKVHLIFLICGAKGTASEHVQILKKLAGVKQNEHFLRFLREAKDAEALGDVIEEMAIA